MSNLKNLSRRRFLTQSGLGLMAFASMPGFLRAMEGMEGLHGMPKLTPNKAHLILNRMLNLIFFLDQAPCPFCPGNRHWCNNTLRC